MSHETCSYEFCRRRWEDERGAELRLTDDVPTDWSCDRPVDKAEHCIFHRPPDDKDDAAVVQQLIDDITTPPTETVSNAVAENRFIGTTFGDCVLSHQVIRGQSTQPIDLRCSRVTGELQWDRLLVTNPIRLTGSVVSGRATFHRAQIRADIDISDTIFHGPIDFSDGQFTQNVWSIYSTMDDEAVFDRCTVGGDLCLAGTEIGHNLRLADTSIDGVGCFSRIICHGAIVSEMKYVGGDLWCVRSVFETLDEDGASNNLLRCNEVQGDIVVRDSTFGDKLTFEDSDIHGQFIFDQTTVRGNWVDLTRCSVTAGEIGQPETGFVMYDLTDATVGDIRLLDSPTNGFERLKFENTTFEGFDFGRHRLPLIESNWTIHTTTDHPQFDRSRSTPFTRFKSRLYSTKQSAAWFFGSLVGRADTRLPEVLVNEVTYLKAKNGAIQNGDNKAGAEFFKKELTYRRKSHAKIALNGTSYGRSWRKRLFAAGAWIANLSLGLSTGYGEKPHRVFLVSLLTIIAFAVVFLFIPDLNSGGEQPVVEMLLLSFQSFITFVLGSPVQSDVSSTARFVTAVEGFIGAFLVALAVFALTRSVHR